MKKIISILICLSFLATNCFSGLIRPNGDVENDNWTAAGGGDLYADIDEAFVEPNDPTGEGNNIYMDSATGTATYDMNMETATMNSNITQVKIWAYIPTIINSKIYLNIKIGDTWQTEQLLYDSDGYNEPGWQSVTFSSLNMTQAQLDAMQIRAYWSHEYGEMGGCAIACLYADEYVAAAGGYTFQVIMISE